MLNTLEKLLPAIVAAALIGLTILYLFGQVNRVVFHNPALWLVTQNF